MRFNVRITPEEKAAIEAAAHHSRMSMTTFVIQAVLTQAEEVLGRKTPAPPEKHYWYEPVEGWGA